MKRHLPSLFTLINLFMGFLSILNTQIGNYEIACYYILIAAAFDSVDGKLARAIGISSNFGKEIDSLADMVSFCLAPSVLIYNLYTQNNNHYLYLLTFSKGTKNSSVFCLSDTTRLLPRECSFMFPEACSGRETILWRVLLAGKHSPIISFVGRNTL